MTTTQQPFTIPHPVAGGLPADTCIERMPRADGGVLKIAAVALPAVEPAGVDAAVADLVGRATAWVAAAVPTGDPPLVIPLYGTHLVWSHHRAAVIGAADRLDAMREAVREFADREAELRDVEARIAAALEPLDADARLAVEFDDRSLPRARELADRFQEAVSLRRRLALLAPPLRRPAPQPPTLAGQLGERLRDRTWVIDRLEQAIERVDLLERVYSGCGDRLAEFTSSRRHATLEWIIILLLAAEVVLITVDLLANRTP